MKVIDKHEGTWIIEDDGVRCFLLEGKDRAALIDTGMHIEDIRGLCASLTEKPLILINTHADRDHIGGNGQFGEVLMSVHEMAHYHSQYKGSKAVALYDGDIIDLGERKLEVIGIPGHTPGSIGLYDIEKRVLISGDPIQRNGRVFMFGEQRDLPAYVSSLRKLDERKGDFDQIWPSHADLPLDSSSIKACLEDGEMLLAGRLEYKNEERFGKKIRAYNGRHNIYLTDDE